MIRLIGGSRTLSQKLGNRAFQFIQVSTIQARNFNYPSKLDKLIPKDGKDFTKMQTVGVTLEELEKEANQQNPKSFKKLSEMATLDKHSEKFKKAKAYRQFAPNKNKINAILRKTMNESIDTTVRSSLDVYERDSMHDQLTSTKENMRRIAEVAEFKKIHFKKAETKRLVERESLKLENVLPGQTPALNISYKQYKNNIDDLKNRRIDNFVHRFTTNNENRKLALLIQSGLMDKSVNINKLIDNSLEALKQERAQGLLPENGAQEGMHPEILHSSETQGSEVETKVSNADKNGQSEIHLVNTGTEMQVLNQQTQLEQVGIGEEFFNLINSTDYEIESGELMKVDFSKLNEFLNEFVRASDEEKYRILDTLRITKEVRQYEELIFDKFRNHDLTLRVKGRMKFEHLTEIENINYIKYNTEGYDELLQIYDNSKLGLTPNIANALIQKLTLFFLTTRKTYDNYDIRMLNVLKDKRYKSLLRYMANNMQDLSNKDFSVLLWSLGKLHYKEKGIIHFDLFEVLKKKVIEQIESRIDSFTLPEISYLGEGLLLLSSTEINLQMEEHHPELSEKILDAMQRHVDYLNENPQSHEFTEHSVIVLQNLASYLAFRRTGKALSIMENLTITLRRNIPVIYDVSTIRDFILAYSACALSNHNSSSSQSVEVNGANQLTETQGGVSNFLVDLTPNIEKQAMNFALDDISSVMALYQKMNIHSPSLIKALKGSLVKGLKDTKKIHDYGASQMVCGFAASDVRRYHPEFKTLDLSRINLILTLFPKQIFQSARSPQYIPYSSIAKVLLEAHQSFSPKNLIMCLFGLSSVKYYNQEFSTMIFPYIESRLPEIDRIDLLSMAVFSLSNLKINDELYFPLLKKIFDIFSTQSKFSHATPHAILQFLAAVANLGDIEGLLSEHLLPLMHPRLLPILDLLDSNSLVCLVWALNCLDSIHEETIEKALAAIKIEELNPYEHYLLHMSLLNLENLNELTNETLQGGKDNRKKIKANYIAFERKLVNDIHALDETNPGVRMTTQDAISHIISSIQSDNHPIQKDTLVGEIMVPLYIQTMNTTIFVYSDECYLKNRKDLLGIFRLKEKVLQARNPGMKVVNISLREFINVEKTVKNIEDLSLARKAFVLKKIQETH